MSRIGFLGCGKMAQAMAKGFLSSGTASSVHGFDPVPECQKVFNSFGAKVCSDNLSTVENSDVVFLSVKPVAVPHVLAEVKPQSADKLFVSVAMGITLKQLESHLLAAARVIRVMPNTPILVKKGASVFVRGRNANEADARITRKLLESVGICEEVPESYLDPVTALSGSGPAYIFVLIEALADGAVKVGLPRELAYKLAAQTVLGAGELVKQNINVRHPGQLKDDVTSPAGSTAAGLQFLEKNAFRFAVQGAVESAFERCQETSKSN